MKEAGSTKAVLKASEMK